MAMLDIDNFKAVNDRYGHTVGDEVLVAVAQLLRDATREGDVLCRYGGEEFALLLRNMDLAQAAAFGERLRFAVERLPAEAAGLRIALTISIGVAAAASAEPDSVEAVVKRADQALYRAKYAGKNRVEVQTFASARLVA
jgi:diguanylate cyclase (GGDEF)-like protein